MSQTVDSKSELFSEDTWFQGVLLTFVAHGSTVTLCIQCFFTFASTLTRAKLMSQLPLLAFVVAVFSLSTIFIGGADSIILAPAAIVDNPHLAQGPEYYEETHWTRHINIMANSTLITLCIIEDMLLLWRCTVVYQTLTVSPWYSLVLASAFWLAELATGALFLFQSSKPLGTLWTTIDFNLAFWSLSLTVNILGTNLIVGRILYCRFRAWQAFKHTTDSQYTSIVAMFVESELLYTAFLILYIVFFGLNNPVQATFLQPMTLVQSTAAIMIVYRVAHGTAWSKNTFNEVTGSGGAVISTVQFNHDVTGTCDDGTDMVMGATTEKVDEDEGMFGGNRVA